LENLLNWVNSVKKSEKQKHNEEKQSGVNRSRSSLSLCFVTPKVEKSNFYEDLERLIDSDFKEIDSKNKIT